MASAVLCQSLSTASQTLMRTIRSWPFTYGHGAGARCLSTKASYRAAPIGSYDKNLGSTPNQLLVLSAMNASSKLLNEGKNSVSEIGPTLIPRKLAMSDSEIALEQSLAQLTLSPLESRLSVAMMLPSSGETLVTTKVILDPPPFAYLRFGCPTATHPIPFYDPDANPHPKEIKLPVKGSVTKKHASNILHKRRRKMNRHQYLKWKKRNKFKRRIHKQRSRKKKRLKWEKHLAQFRFTGLKPGEGEEYLAKKREKMAIFLKYLGIKTDEEEEMEKKKTEGQARKAGKVVPERPLPQGAKM